MPANTYGRQVVVPLTNKSGGAVALGDVVIVDTGNNDAFTTTTSAAFTGGIGVVQETIANNAIGRVLLSGYTSLVNVNASVTRGHWGATHTVAKQAADASARGAGTFCQFLTGGTTPDAIVYPPDLAAAALTDPMTTRGDIIVRNASNVTARLAAGAANTVFMGGTDPSYVALGGSVSSYAGTSFTITTTTPAAVSTTNARVTITTGARHVLIGLVCSAAVASTGQFMCLDFAIDGTREGQTDGLFIQSNFGGAGLYPTNMTHMSKSALSAGSHNFDLYAWVGSTHTGTIFATAALTPLTLWVAELSF